MIPLFDHVPVLVKNPVEGNDEAPDDAQKESHQGQLARGPQDVHEHAVAELVGAIDGLVDEGVVEDEQRIVVPEMLLVGRRDVNGVVLERDEVVKHAQSDAQRAVMCGGALVLVEDGDANGLDVFERLVKFRDGQGVGDVLAIPFEENHAALLLGHPFAQFADDLRLVVRERHQQPDFFLAFIGQVSQLVDAPVSCAQQIRE